MDDSLEVDISKAVVTSYDGDIDETTGLYSGFGEATFSNGGCYEGNFELGLFHGKGKYIWADTSVFEGDFISGIICGQGTFTWANGSKYEGSVKDGKRHGSGQYTAADGQLYNGEWVDGKRHGKGKMHYSAEKSVLYVGSWSEGLRHGYGTMRYASGNIYEGEWAADKKCGDGVMVWKDVDEMYLGEWAEDQPHGQGEYIWADSAAKPSLKRCMCNMYRGQWANGSRAGVGTFFYSDGSQYTGEWADNQKDGSGVYCHADGRIHFGFFAADRMLLNDALPKETDAVTPQVKIHIDDILEQACPGDLAYAASATKTIERLILRYNSTIRQVCKRYVDFANAKRKLAIDPPPEDWPRLEKLRHTTRNIHKRLATSTLGEFWRFCREFSITGAHFSLHDVCMCLSEMQANRRFMARERQLEQERESARLVKEAEVAMFAPMVATNKASQRSVKSKSVLKNSNTSLPPKSGRKKSTENTASVRTILPVISAAPPKPAIPLKALRPAAIEDLLVPAICPAKDRLVFDPRYPLREYEFVELFVRCAVRSHLNLAMAHPPRDPVFSPIDVVDDNGRMATMNTLGTTQGMGNTLNKMRTGTVRPTNGIDIAEFIYSDLAEKLHAVTTDWNQIPSLASDLYSSAVQQMLIKNANVVTEIFERLNADGGSEAPTLRNVVVYFLSLKSPSADFAKPTVSAGCTLMKLIETLCESLVDEDPVTMFNNMTKLNSQLIQEDFVELLCKLVLSDLWIFGEEPAPEPAALPAAEAADPALEQPAESEAAPMDELALTASDIKMMTSSQIIIDKLSLWFESYKKEPEPPVVESVEEAPTVEQAPVEGAEGAV